MKHSNAESRISNTHGFFSDCAAWCVAERAKRKQPSAHLIAPPLPTRLAFASTQNEPICSVFLSRTCTTRVKGNSHKQTEFTLLLLCCSFIFTRLERLRWPLVRSNYWRNKSSNLESRVYWSLAPTFPAEDFKTDNLQTVFSCCAGFRIKKSMCAAKSSVFLKCYVHGVLTSLLCHFGRQ